MKEADWVAIFLQVLIVNIFANMVVIPINLSLLFISMVVVTLTFIVCLILLSDKEPLKFKSHVEMNFGGEIRSVFKFKNNTKEDIFVKDFHIEISFKREPIIQEPADPRRENFKPLREIIKPTRNWQTVNLEWKNYKKMILKGDYTFFSEIRFPYEGNMKSLYHSYIYNWKGELYERG